MRLPAILSTFGTLVLLLLSPSGARAQENDETRIAEPEAVIRQILSDWQDRLARTRTVRYRIVGDITFPKGIFTHMPDIYPEPPGGGSGAPEGEFPERDYVLPYESTLVLAFEDRLLVRRETESQQFYLSAGGGQVVPDIRIEAFNGTVSQRLQASEENEIEFRYQPDLYLYPDHDASAAHIVSFVDYPIFFAHGIVPRRTGSGSLGSQFREPLSAEDYRVRGEGIHDGRQCVVLRTAAADDELSRFHEIWVDVERQSAIVRWLSYSRGSASRVLEAHWQETPQGWLPAAWTVNSYLLDGTLEGIHRMRVAEYAINSGSTTESSSSTRVPR